MIVDQLAGDRESLKRCSLVSKRWRPRSRYQLFRVVVFSDSLPRQSIEHWCTTFDPFNGTYLWPLRRVYSHDELSLIGTLASLTRELHFHQDKRSWVRPTVLAPHLPHLGHFTNVTTLGFANLVTSSFHAASLSDCFGSLITSVRRLRLNRPIARPVSLAQTIFLFSAAVDIEIQYPRWSVVEENAALVGPPPGSLGFTGTLHLRGFGERWPQFFDLLSARPLRFQKTRLMECEFSTPIPTQSLLDAVSGSTRTLHLVGFGNRELRHRLRRKPSLS